MVLVPALYGLGTAIPLVVGAVVGVYLSLPQRLVAALLAFASGALLTGLAFELFQPAVRTVGIGTTAMSLFAGTGLYVLVKYRLGTSDGLDGYPLLAAVVFDGLAENITLGVALVGGSGGGPLAILVGVAANNLPEAIAGAASMAENGNGRTLGVWTATATGLAAAVVVSNVAFSNVGASTLALVRATGGGAVLASLAVEIMPDAYEIGDPSIAFATAAGFLVTFLLV